MGGRRKMMRRRTAAAGAALLLSVVGTVGVAGTAWADDGDGGTCVAIVVSTSGASECFDSALAAFSSATDGSVDQADLDAAAAGDTGALDQAVESHNGAVARHAPLKASTAAAAASALSVAPASSSLTDGPILGALWKDKNYKGEVAILQGTSGSGCYGVTYGFPHAKAFGMNDEISSLATYSGCAVTLYKDANYKGTTLTIQVESAYVGNAMNDETSSVVFRPRS